MYFIFVLSTIKNNCCFNFEIRIGCSHSVFIPHWQSLSVGFFVFITFLYIFELFNWEIMCSRNFILILILLLILSVHSCAVGSGCPAEKAETVKFDRRGKLKNDGGKTRLFPGKK